MDGDNSTVAAQKEALGFWRDHLNKAIARGKQRPAAQAEPDGNVGEVMEREPQIEAEEEGEPLEQEMAEEAPRRTVLERFSPRTGPEQVLHVKRGPGRPRKVR